MALYDDKQRRWAETLRALMWANPFLEERIAAERELLGPAYRAEMAVWHYRADSDTSSPNGEALRVLVGAFVEAARERLATARPGDAEVALYGDLVQYGVYDRHRVALHELVTGDAAQAQTLFRSVKRDLAYFLKPLGDAAVPDDAAVAHVVALYYQVRRAFHGIFSHLIGGSLPIARLRANVWQSIFTHDMRRYQRVLYRRMTDVATLITGPSGTGKELVARAIAQAPYIPYQPRVGFGDPGAAGFYPLNLSALSENLLESELFGHRKGSFTGAATDHVGWLETCGPCGTVFLDEIGDVTGAVQVKLLRTLESRQFNRLGETETRRFAGKLMAATHRDLAAMQAAGEFRHDLYYRLCADQIQTPTLRAQIDADPQALADLVRGMANTLVGPEEAAAFTAEVVAWVERHLPADYPWPGNVRELSQCVRNLLIRGDYRPAHAPGAGDDAALTAIQAGDWNADVMLTWYCRRVYARTGSYSAAARHLGLDRRTVKARVES